MLFVLCAVGAICASAQRTRLVCVHGRQRVLRQFDTELVLAGFQQVYNLDIACKLDPKKTQAQWKKLYPKVFAEARTDHKRAIIRENQWRAQQNRGPMTAWEIETHLRKEEADATEWVSTAHLQFVRAEFPSHGAIFYGRMGADWIAKRFLPSRLFREWHLPKIAERKGYNAKTATYHVKYAYACPKSPADPLNKVSLEGTLNRDGRTKAKPPKPAETKEPKTTKARVR